MSRSRYFYTPAVMTITMTHEKITTKHYFSYVLHRHVNYTTEYPFIKCCTNLQLFLLSEKTLKIYESAMFSIADQGASPYISISFHVLVLNIEKLF